MYFFILLVLIFSLIPNPLEKKYSIILYLKILLVSIIYFYYLSFRNENIYYLILTLITYSIITILIYRIFDNSDKESNDTSIYNLAHEVKNPMSVCKGYLDMIDINDTDKLNKYLPIIKKEMTRSLDIMNEFLSFKKMIIEKDLMDVSILIDEVLETINVLLKETSIDLSVIKPDKEIIIDGDYEKLKQVLINLIKNSYEAKASNIKIDLKLNNKFVKIRVIDNGIGIDDIKKIGTIFYTTKPNGTGIGVSLSKKIIDAHNGSLTYTSNKETIATIILPIRYVF